MKTAPLNGAGPGSGVGVKRDLERREIRRERASRDRDYQMRMLSVKDGSVVRDWQRVDREDYEANKPGSVGTHYRVQYRALYPR